MRWSALGMEVGNRKEPYEVLLIEEDGSTEVLRQALDFRFHWSPEPETQALLRTTPARDL